MATFRQRNGRWQAIIRRVDLKATRSFDRLVDAKTWARARELISEGQDAALAAVTIEILGKTTRGKAIMEKVNALSESEVDAGLRSLEPPAR